ncbi:hypothetical protein C8R45DRAFT_934085 [Mycena sanguinolenta]|nr:hypothetical protein C8R45DRAFT_934085 [Mycena sanguinolenta]
MYANPRRPSTPSAAPAPKAHPVPSEDGARHASRDEGGCVGGRCEEVKEERKEEREEREERGKALNWKWRKRTSSFEAKTASTPGAATLIEASEIVPRSVPFPILRALALSAWGSSRRLTRAASVSAEVREKRMVWRANRGGSGWALEGRARR